MSRILIPTSVILFAAGCTEFELKSSTGTDGDLFGDCTPAISLSPSEINFGELKVVNGDQATQAIQIINDGDCTLNISDVRLEDDVLGVFEEGAISTPVLEPGGIASITVTFVPVTDATSNARLVFASDDPDDPTASVKLNGDGIAPKIQVSPRDYDFGSIYVGCEIIQPITIKNVGRDDLVVDNFSYLSASVDFTFNANEYTSNGSDANGRLPWTLAPDAEIDTYVTYYPLDEYDDDGFLYVYSNDPFTNGGETLVTQTGDGDILGENTDTFEQPLQAESDILFAVDKSCSMSDDIASVQSNFKAFTGTLEGLDADYRVAAIVQDSGQVYGGTPYIDQDNAEDAVDIITEMLSGPYGGATEMAFTLLYNAMGTGSGYPGSWIREDAKLNLVGVSDEPEQSTRLSWEDYVAYFQSLKEDEDDLVMHAIGGDYPSGCGGNAAYTGFYEAVAATGGIFLSICAEDWASSLTELAEQSAASLNIFDLSQVPVPETIVVEVNGAEVHRGWDYEPDGNAVVFEEDETPEGGSIIEISYVLMSDCDF